MSRRRPLDDLDHDIREHLERETESNIARGMAPEEARAAARRAFGSVTAIKEDVRAVWVPAWLDQGLQDLRYAMRLWRRSPGFSAIVVLTLALGIGLNTAVFSVVNAVLIRPLSYPHADRLVWLATADPRGPGEYVASPVFAAWREQSRTIEQFAGFFTAAERIEVDDDVRQARVAAVTDGFWDLSGARFALGGPPAPGRDGVVLTHEFFERWFHADPSIVRRSVMLEGRASGVAGVLAPRFRVQLPPPPSLAAIGAGDIDLYRAVIIRPPSPATGVLIFHVVGRLKPGATIGDARPELETILARVRAAYPAGVGGPRFIARSYQEQLVGQTRTPLAILLAAVVLVLVVACVNIANLMLARGSARQREIAIRAALGAGRGRVLRQFLVESLLLAGIGGALGLLAARWAIGFVLRLIPQAVPRLAETSIDGRVLAFAAVASIATAVIFGLVPALSIHRTDVHTLLKDGVRTASASAGGLRVRRSLVAIELALTVVLLVAAGLMLKSFWRVTAYPPGFTPDRVLTMKVQFSGPQYRDQAKRRAFIDEVLRRTATAPGVTAVGVGSNGDANMLIVVDGAPEVPRDQRPAAMLSSASAGYAAALGLRVVTGRWLTDAEPSGAFVINEAFARTVFPDEDPIGKRIRLPYLNDVRFLPIVGVVADLRYSSLDAAPAPELFVDYAHAGIFSTTITIRTAGDPAAAAPALKTLLSPIDRTQPIFAVRPLDQVLAESIAPRRFNVWLLGTFAGAALVLALIGIYGVIAYSVSQRTQEIGVRMALGADRANVVWMVVRQGMVLAAVGLFIGLAGALAATRVLTSVLDGVTPTDPATFAGVAGLLAATTLVASAGPALMAARIDPIVALRYE